MYSVANTHKVKKKLHLILRRNESIKDGNCSTCEFVMAAIAADVILRRLRRRRKKREGLRR